MAAKAKTSYKITNWRKYNESLVQRGSITFLFSDDVIDQWEHANEEPKVGHPFVYSDTIERCWGILALLSDDGHWNGTLLESVETALSWEKR